MKKLGEPVQQGMFQQKKRESERSNFNSENGDNDGVKDAQNQAQE